MSVLTKYQKNWRLFNMSQTLAKNNIQKLKGVLSADSVQQQFKNALKENAGAFVASVIDLYGSDSYLQQCDPNAVVMEALKAATLKLPINKQLGFAYIVPYKGVPQFQLGYKGYIQLAMRTGQYKHLNAGVVYEGVEVKRDILTGEIEFLGEPTSDKAIGYFTYFELINGFRKTLYMTREEVIAHAKRYSPSFNFKTSAWKTNFDEMATKTVTRLLLSKYGIMSVDMANAIANDMDAETAEAKVEDEIKENANAEVIDVNVNDAIDVETIEEANIPEEPGF
jgi:recombination protein RecT